MGWTAAGVTRARRDHRWRSTGPRPRRGQTARISGGAPGAWPDNTEEPLAAQHRPSSSSAAAQADGPEGAAAMRAEAWRDRRWRNPEGPAATGQLRPSSSSTATADTAWRRWCCSSSTPCGPTSGENTGARFGEVRVRTRGEGRCYRRRYHGGRGLRVAVLAVILCSLLFDRGLSISPVHGLAPALITIASLQFRSPRAAVLGTPVDFAIQWLFDYCSVWFDELLQVFVVSYFLIVVRCRVTKGTITLFDDMLSAPSRYHHLMQHMLPPGTEHVWLLLDSEQTSRELHFQDLIEGTLPLITLHAATL